MEKQISIKNLSYRYEGSSEYALKGVNLDIAKGEWVAIIGHNGSGKSTLSRFFNALLLPVQGDVRISSYNSKDAQSLWDIRRTVGLVFQNPDNQLVATTVKDDIAFGLENFGFDRETMEDRIVQSASKVGIDHLLLEEPHRLSGGQKQRVAIAGIIAIKPEVIVLDEATSMLDPIGRREVISTIQEVNHTEKITIVSITHDLAEAALADRIIVMNQGEIVLTGTPKQVFENSATLYRYGLELPFAVEVRERLVELGYDISTQALTAEEVINELWTLQSKT
ncbi:energy-coupling factor transporter ATPase [Bacillus alkalicellulosilyticus]|uniref:energy-coupling factor transporter ATPase n=1 Tax=Alkalihalobacterium alkalicellulosilyticum TaxID=1912214 RepID=UPI000997082A|nr:energy-coupling factor transporter ATPase [Bacillus alkalicellulosilyticus]